MNQWWESKKNRFFLEAIPLKYAISEWRARESISTNEFMYSRPFWIWNNEICCIPAAMFSSRGRGYSARDLMLFALSWWTCTVYASFHTWFSTSSFFLSLPSCHRIAVLYKGFSRCVCVLYLYYTDSNNAFAAGAPTGEKVGSICTQHDQNILFLDFLKSFE